MLAHIKKLTLAFALAAFGAAILTAANAVMEFSARLGTVNPWIECAFLAAVGCLCLWFVLLPLLSLARLPRYCPPPETRDSPRYRAYLKTLCEHLKNSPALNHGEPEHDRGIDIGGGRVLTRADIQHALRHEPLQEAVVDQALPALDALAGDLIADRALGVGILTALAPSGRMDAIIVLVNNVTLVTDLIRMYRTRPALLEIVRLYALAGGAAFIADQIDDLDFNTLFIEASSAAGIGASVIPLVGESINVAVQGCVNAYLTLRVGHAVRIACGATDLPTLRAARRLGRNAAARELKTVAGRLVHRIRDRFKGMPAKEAGAAAP